MPNPTQLTPSELRILRLVIAGETSRAIAEETFISERALQILLDHIANKIGVRTRLTEGMWALEHGLRAVNGQTPG